MAQENYAGTSLMSFTAGGTITRNQVVYFSAAPKTVVATTAITQQVIGVAQQAAASGEQVPCVTVPGTLVTMVAGAAITAGAEVMPQATGPGKVITAAGATALSCGIAMTTVTTDGDLVEVLFRPSVKSPANS
jgi:Uncharacterized conserved protein (DUF2190)